MPTNWKLQLPNLISKYFCSFHKTPRGCPTSDPNIYQRSRVKSNCSEKFILKREASLSTAEQHYWLDSLLHYPSTTGRCQSRLVNLMCAIPCPYPPPPVCHLFQALRNEVRRKIFWKNFGASEKSPRRKIIPPRRKNNPPQFLTFPKKSPPIPPNSHKQ